MKPHPLLADAFGLAPPVRHFDPARALAEDRVLDGALALFDWHRLSYASTPSRVLLLLPAYPASAISRQSTLALWTRAVGTRHRVTIRFDDRAGVSRSRKILEATKAARDHDWLIVIDDDVVVGDGFLDRLIAAADAAGLMIAQPAHRIHSYASFLLTQRRSGSIARTSRFVEIGPVVAIRSAVMSDLPLPPSRWGWGIDMLWADMAASRRWRLGIVDGTPIEHLRPVNYDVPHLRPLMEASTLLRCRPIRLSRRDMLTGDEVRIAMD